MARNQFVGSRLFRLQKYKKFESNSQPSQDSHEEDESCFDCKSTKNLRAIHNFKVENKITKLLFRLQKYKKFESNSQLCPCTCVGFFGCFDCKSTKNLRAIHNINSVTPSPDGLFRLQKYKKFESNSQPYMCLDNQRKVVSTAKVQKI